MVWVTACLEEAQPIQYNRGAGGVCVEGALIAVEP